METLLLVVHVFVAFFLIIVVLLQAGKGANIGATFGGSSQTVFGSRGPASFLGKMTTAAAAMFMVTSLVLSMFSSKGASSSIADSIQGEAPPAQTAPADDPGFDPFKAATEKENQGTADAPKE